MQLADFDYHLPEERIAQEALADRAASRMLVIHRQQARWEDRAFRDLPEYLRPGDCLSTIPASSPPASSATAPESTPCPSARATPKSGST